MTAKPPPQRPAEFRGAPAARKGACELVPFVTAPFPYRGQPPKADQPFLDIVEGHRRGHSTARGGVYWEEQTYSDRRALLYIPPAFDSQLPMLIIVYFHGNATMLERDVCTRDHVPQQLAATGLNAVLVAPQLAVDALDSSPGKFWEKGAFADFLHEAATHLAELYGNKSVRSSFDKVPVVIVAYSGGYLPAAWVLAVGGAEERVQGVVLLDGIYGEQEKFADWIGRRQRKAFFLSAFSDSSRADNVALRDMLKDRRLHFAQSGKFPLVPGSVSFLDAGPTVDHATFLTRAWVSNPLAWVLARIPGFQRPAD
jgi:hypothetical protein